MIGVATISAFLPAKAAIAGGAMRFEALEQIDGNANLERHTVIRMNLVRAGRLRNLHVNVGEADFHFALHIEDYTVADGMFDLPDTGAHFRRAWFDLCTDARNSPVSVASTRTV